MTAIEEGVAARPGGVLRETVDMARTLGAGLVLALVLRVVVFAKRRGMGRT